MVARRIDAGKDVVISSDMVDSLYDMISAVSQQLQTIGCGHIPLHIVSPCAKTSLHLANIYGEWQVVENDL